MSTDEMIRNLAEELKFVNWMNCKNYGTPDDTMEWYYAENRLYVLRKRKMEAYYFVYAKSPAEAFEKLRERFRNQNKGKS